MGQAKNRKVLLAIAGLVLGAMCWGGNSVAGRLSVGEIPPIALSFWRWTSAFIILLAISGTDVWRLRTQIWQHKKQLIPLALLSITSFNTLLYLSAQSTQAVNIALIQTALPVVAISLSIPLLNEKPTLNQLFGGVVAIPGLLLIFSQGQLDNLLALKFGKGDLIMFFAVFCWGVIYRTAAPLPLAIQRRSPVDSVGGAWGNHVVPGVFVGVLNQRWF